MYTAQSQADENLKKAHTKENASDFKNVRMSKELAKSERTQSLIELEARDKRRLETLIDAVFAIAITLLGLGLVVPIVQHSNEALAASLVGIGPKFVGYFLAFALLGILLNSNWRQFQNIVFANWVLYFINILFLSFVVLVPFATTVWTTYPETTAGVVFFHGIMFITGLILYVNWAYVRRNKYLLKEDISARTIRIITLRSSSLSIASALAIVIAFFSPPISNVAYLLIGFMLGIAPLHARSRRVKF